MDNKDKRVIRGNNSHTLRTQKLLSDARVITFLLIVEDILLLLIWNIILNFIFNIPINIETNTIIRYGFYTGHSAWKFYIIYIIFIGIFDAVQAYRMYTSFSEKDINVGQKGTLAAYARAFQINMDELLPMAIDTQNIISTLLYLDQLIPLIIECRPSGKTYMMFQAGILDEFLSEWKEMKSKRVHGLISEEQYKQWENMFLQKE